MWARALFAVIFVGIVCGFALPASAEVVRGVVVKDHYECEPSDRVIIETSKGYTLAEVYSGYGAAIEGKVILGDFHSYGFTEFFDSNGDQRGRLYIDDWMASDSTAIEWCFEDQIEQQRRSLEDY